MNFFKRKRNDKEENKDSAKKASDETNDETKTEVSDNEESSKLNKSNGPWTELEKDSFKTAIRLHGKKIGKIHEAVKTRSSK